MEKAASAIVLTVFFLSVLMMPSLQPFEKAIGVTQIERSNSLLLQFSFPPPTVAEDSAFDSISILGLPQYGAPGEPVLPFKIVDVLIPRGKEVQQVHVTTGNRRMLEGRFNVAFGRTSMPISSNASVVDQPDENIYNSVNPYPGSLFSQMSEQYARGYEVLPLKFYPVQYIPGIGELYYFETMTVTVTLRETCKLSSLFRNSLEDNELILNIVSNPHEANTYTETMVGTTQAESARPLASYDYVVVTNNDLRSSFQTLVNWKIQKGLTATIVLVEDIMKNPNYNSNGLYGDGSGSPRFNDTQAHIRNFIKDAYLNWDTKYVLLGGDDEIIPSRGVYCSGGYYSNYSDYNIPCDMYYGALDGSWDKDNDTIFGEAVYHWTGPENGTAGEEADFFAEVYVGRATVDTAQEAMNFVNKTVTYEQTPQANYLKKALMIGNTLDPITEGGNGKDRTSDIIPQYTTTRLYSRDGTYDRAAVINEMNNGTHIVNHDGHSNYLTVMGLYRSDVDSLTNTEYFMVYSLGCYSAAFDEATSGSTEAVAEHFIFNSHGAFAYIGNSRYGWYCSASTDGPGDRYDQMFFTLINNGTRNLGKALQLSKELEPVLDRWTCFTLNLLGDPEAEIATVIKAPTAHFETRADLLTPLRIGGTVDFQGTAKRGTASGSTFKNFTIEFGQGTSPASWMTTGISLSGDGKNEIVGGTLGTWNTSLLASGTYTLRLNVFDSDGVVGEDRRVVAINQNAVPTYIKNDGNVEPSTAPIQRNGNVYTLTGNITSDSDGVIIQKDGITFDGAGHFIQGNGGGSAGIQLFGISNAIVKNVTVKSRLYGIYLKQSSNNIILGCHSTNNSHGIFLVGSSNNGIIGNDVEKNYDGICLMFLSNNNSLAGNRIAENIGALTGGIYLYVSSNNAIYHNIFMNNSLHIYDAAWDCSDTGIIAKSVNQWDDGYPSGGNCWSGYSGTDQYTGPYQNMTGSDGIIDTPYVLDMNSRDNYPLVVPYGPAHDVAISSIVPLKTVVGQNYCVNISTIAVDYGVYGESFNVSVYANSTMIYQTLVTLTARNSITLTFTWNATGFVFGNFTVKAVADIVQNETNTADNIRIADASIHIGVPGDISSATPGVLDGIANMRDINYLVLLFNTNLGSPNWNPNADVNNDGICNMRDINIAIVNFNRHE